jgi:hypothetical protein
MVARQNEYEFVAVGGGTADLLWLRVLPRTQNVSALVLKAGGNALKGPGIAVPAMWSSILGTEFDQDFLTKL